MSNIINMEQYIKKSAIVAEIKKLIDGCYKMCAGNLDFLKKGYPEHYYSIENYKEILSFIDALEVKEIDLEEKATQLAQKYFPDEENIWARSNIEAQKCKSACIEMVEWLKAQKGEEI